MVELSRLDRRLVRVLRRHPRATLAELARECGTSERTSARHLRSLQANGTVRFTASLRRWGSGEALTATLDVVCEPGRMSQVAEAFAARDDIEFAAQTAGSSDVVAQLVAPDRRTLAARLAADIPRTRGVLSVRSGLLLDALLDANDWDPDGGPDTPRRARVKAGAPRPGSVRIDDKDRAIGHVLREDARMPASGIAARVALSEASVHRRLQRLIESEALVPRCEVAAEMLGYPVETRFALNVAPRYLADALRRLAGEPVIRSLQVVTGPHNVLGYAAHRDPSEISDLHHHTFAALRGVLALDVGVVLHATKRAWARLPAPL
jgi:DNA-binding Lrp family transcriptional regulator